MAVGVDVQLGAIEKIQRGEENGEVRCLGVRAQIGFLKKFRNKIVTIWWG